MKRTQLPVLSPCTADWDTMTPAGRARFCAECQTHVHHVSAMKRADAAAFLHAHAGQDLCVRYAYDGAGNVRFADTASTAITAAQALWPSLRAIAAVSTLVVGAASVGTAGISTATALEFRSQTTSINDELAVIERALLLLELERKRAEDDDSEIMGRVARTLPVPELSDEERMRRKAALHDARNLHLTPTTKK